MHTCTHSPLWFKFNHFLSLMSWILLLFVVPTGTEMVRMFSHSVAKPFSEQSQTPDFGQ